MPAIAPTYSVYTDLRNGFTVGIHKIHLLKEQLNTGAETYVATAHRKGFTNNLSLA